MRTLTLLSGLVAFVSIAGPRTQGRRIVYSDPPEALITPLGGLPLEGGKACEVHGGYVVESFEPGTLISLQALVEDASGSVLARHASSPQQVWARGFEHLLRIPFVAPTNACRVRLEMACAANPVTFRAMPVEVRPPRPSFEGRYDPEDPPPENRAKAIEEMAKIPPATARIECRTGRNLAVVDGKVMPFNQYKGVTDYRMMGESGGDMVMTMCRGARLFVPASFDRPDWDEKKGMFDFSRIEDTLLRIYHANPRARVMLDLVLDPHQAFLERHPDAIFVNARGERGKVQFVAFKGFDSKPLDPTDIEQRWAFSYTSSAWQELVTDALRQLCAYLKKTPASNIVVGFQLSGGMDGQFQQWQYGPENGHFDYSEANRRALCAYLRELYGSDEELRKAWGDSTVTLETARNPTPSEFASVPVFDDRPGFGRRLADCRRFVAVGLSRALNGFARTLRSEFGRPCLVSSYYSSTIWSQPGRLALDELTKNGGVDTIVMVTDYDYKRVLDGVGGAADHSIAGVNLRGLLYVQELDHRTWRTSFGRNFLSSEAEDAAIPRNAGEFASQILRDGSSVIAAGGTGFYFYDMYGSWYHDDEAQAPIRRLFALNRFATKHAGEYPLPRIGIFADEKARLLRETTYNNVSLIWRTSGVMPAIHYLTDIEASELPDYDLYIVWQPVTISASQVEAFRRRASRPGKVLAVIGEAGVGSLDFAGTADVMMRFGMTVVHHKNVPQGDVVVPVDDVKSPLLSDVRGVIEAGGMYIVDGRLLRRGQYGFATVSDSSATILGRWQQSGEAAFASKQLGSGTIVFMARDAGLTPQLLHNLAKSAHIRPYANSGNAVYVGNGVACVHRLAGKAMVDFGRSVRLVDPETGVRSKPTRFWSPSLKSGEAAAIGYVIDKE
ncbi:MAG: hypothetical protein IJG13_11670 [Kiritimatiellae bacterium]|nr:hypothetical protein [Kiritimatiellia bacterium]